MENERKDIDRVGTPSSLEELTEWLENNEIDHPEYDRKFAELKRLEEEDENGED
jgi:hypothetical protein